MNSDAPSHSGRRNNNNRRRGGRGRNNNYGNNRRGDFRRDSNNAPKKSGGIIGFLKKLFGFGSQPKANTSSYAKPARDERRSTEPRNTTNGATPVANKEKDEVLPEVLNPKLYVGNLSYETSESDLYDLFQQVGAVKNVEIVRDRQSNSKGFGFVEMQDLDIAKAASAKFHRTEFMGRQLVVSGAKS